MRGDKPVAFYGILGKSGFLSLIQYWMNRSKALIVSIFAFFLCNSCGSSPPHTPTLIDESWRYEIMNSLGAFPGEKLLAVKSINLYSQDEIRQMVMMRLDGSDETILFQAKGPLILAQDVDVVGQNVILFVALIEGEFAIMRYRDGAIERYTNVPLVVYFEANQKTGEMFFDCFADVFRRISEKEAYTSLCKMKIEGGDVEEVFYDSSLLISAPRVHPNDNSKIMTFAFDVSRNPLVQSIFLIDFVNKKASILIENGAFSRWSIDGESIVFARRTGRRLFDDDIFIAQANGTEQKRLTYTGRTAYPMWSSLEPDRIYFNESERLDNVLKSNISDIWTIKKDGTGLKQITSAKEHEGYTPMWIGK